MQSKRGLALAAAVALLAAYAGLKTGTTTDVVPTLRSAVAQSQALRRSPFQVEVN